LADEFGERDDAIGYQFQVLDGIGGGPSTGRGSSLGIELLSPHKQLPRDFGTNEPSRFRNSENVKALSGIRIKTSLHGWFLRFKVEQPKLDHVVCELA
jgi:hypothetical protein